MEPPTIAMRYRKISMFEIRKPGEAVSEWAANNSTTRRRSNGL